MNRIEHFYRQQQRPEAAVATQNADRPRVSRGAAILPAPPPASAAVNVLRRLAVAAKAAARWLIVTTAAVVVLPFGLAFVVLPLAGAGFAYVASLLLPRDGVEHGAFCDCYRCICLDCRTCRAECRCGRGQE